MPKPSMKMILTTMRSCDAAVKIWARRSKASIATFEFANLRKMQNFTFQPTLDGDHR